MRQNSHEKKQVYDILPGWHNLWLVLVGFNSKFDPQSVISKKCRQLIFFEAKNCSQIMFSHPKRTVSDLLRTASDTLSDPDPLVLKISIIPRPSYRVFTNLLAIGPIFGQILSALIV